MDNRKEIIKAYKMRPVNAGVFQIKCLVNGKVYFGSSLNLHGPFNRLKLELSMGNFRSRSMQEDWNRYGAEQFSFDILETLEPNSDPNYDYAEDLSILEQIWLDKLEPFGERGYNVDKKFRMA